METKKNRILIIDDDNVLRDRLGQALARRGYFCEEASNIKDGLSIAKESFPNWVILDLKMPGGLGIDLIPELIESDPEVKILLLTAYGSVATAVSAIKLGAINYLIKPVEVNSILACFDAGSKSSEASQQEELNELSLAEIEWEHLQKVLLENSGNISKAAKALGIHRRTLQRKLERER